MNKMLNIKEEIIKNKPAGGADYFLEKTEIGLSSGTNDNNWNLVFQPAAGILFNIDENARLNISAKFNYIHKNSSVNSQVYFNAL